VPSAEIGKLLHQILALLNYLGSVEYREVAAEIVYDLSEVSTRRESAFLFLLHF